MNKGRVTLFILSFLVIVSISLWIFSARIVSALVPSLLNRDTIEITSLEIASVGFNRTEIHRLTGHALIASGTLPFDIENATVSYDLRRLEAGNVRIDRANVAYHPVPGADSSRFGAATIALPPQISVDHLRFTYDDRFDFSGRFEFSSTGRSFTVDAVDERSHLRLRGDDKLSAFDVRIDDADGNRMADGRIDLDASDLDGFSLAFTLEHVAPWLRETGILPAPLAEQLDVIESASGNMRLDGRRHDDRWGLDFDLDLHRLVTGSVYSRVALAGGFKPHHDGWTSTLSRTGDIRVTTVDDTLADVYSFSASLPPGYTFTEGRTEAGLPALTGAGIASVAVYRAGGLELEALMTQWSLSERRKAHFELSGVVVSDPLRLSIEDLSANAVLSDTAPYHASGDVKLSGAKADAWPQDVDAVDLIGEWQWSDGSVTANGTANLGGPPQVSWELSTLYNTGEVRVDLDTGLPDLIKPFDKHIESNWPHLELMEGSATGWVNWKWDDDRYDTRLELRGSGARGRLMGLGFEGASLEVTSSDLVAPTLRLEGRFPSIKLANDVDVDDVSVSGRWQSGLHLDKAAMSVLGGQVKINPVFLDAHDPDLEIELELTDMDLEQVFQMVDQDGLEGSGRLSGTIPIQWTESGVAINNGRMTNTTEGHISYNIGNDAAAQVDNIALQALQDFRYDLLDVTLNYQLDGDYSIRARIEGRNPSLYDGYPVAFNLNLTGNLPGLLRASLITGDFQSEILRQIQQPQ